MCNFVKILLFATITFWNEIWFCDCSYLGLGLMAARQNIFLIENSGVSNKFYSSCINPQVTYEKWSYGGKNYVVQ